MAYDSVTDDVDPWEIETAIGVATLQGARPSNEDGSDDDDDSVDQNGPPQGFLLSTALKALAVGAAGESVATRG